MTYSIADFISCQYRHFIQKCIIVGTRETARRDTQQSTCDYTLSLYTATLINPPTPINRVHKTCLSHIQRWYLAISLTGQIAYISTGLLLTRWIKVSECATFLLVNKSPMSGQSPTPKSVFA